MILIKIKDQSNLIEVSGHANFANKGKDIVCSAVSAVTFGALNTLEQLVSKKVDIQVSDNFISIKVIDKSSLELKVIIKQLIISYEMIEENYKNYIKIERD